MELALSLGDTPKPFSFLDKNSLAQNPTARKDPLGFCMGLGPLINGRSDDRSSSGEEEEQIRRGSGSSSEESDHPPVQLDLLPFSPVPRHHQPPSQSRLPFPWLSQNLLSRPGSSDTRPGRGPDRQDVNRMLPAMEEGEDGGSHSSPNSAVSSFQMDFSMYRSGRSGKRDLDLETISVNEFETDHTGGGGGSSRASDEEENGLNRKKLRLSKEQSAFLEESFKEHNTLNPKQKLALAKQLNLRPRQVEVWFQNRRARTKLKQTEVDCEYLKRCCETLSEENRRLQKELQELRALKTAQPFYMQLPATTLTMCPSCERVATTTTSTTVPANAATISASASASAEAATNNNTTLSLAKPMSYPFTNSQAHAQQAAS